MAKTTVEMGLNIFIFYVKGNTATCMYACLYEYRRKACRLCAKSMLQTSYTCLKAYKACILPIPKLLLKRIQRIKTRLVQFQIFVNALC